MKQVLQNVGNGETQLVDVPVPSCTRGACLIQTRRTLISAGTERMLVDFGRAGWLDKARQQPDKVKMVLEKVKTDGLLATVDAVRSKLDQPLPLGYCNVGVVSKVGEGVTEYQPGDRVVSNGHHAEFVNVPKNLCARIPDGVTDEHAVFTVLGAIGLQGIRLANTTIGECVVVTGLGLIGLLTVQILRAHGCRVLGLDINPSRLALARQFGAETVDLAAGEDPLAAANRFSRGRGVDAVLITASSESNEPVSQAAKMCRKRGRIVLVGVTGLELSRADFYEKELSFQVSCSYGPGRYDAAYEDKGHDYPVGFVRWTEQRNFEAVLDLMAAGQLDLDPLITHSYGIDEAVDAFEALVADSSALGIVLEYKADEDRAPETAIHLDGASRDAAQPVVSLIGAGNYASRVLMPAFKRANANLRMLVTQGGPGAVHHGDKHGFGTVATDAALAFADPHTNIVVVATRHDSHAEYVLKAIEAGKDVFVEKPLCLTLEELASIESVMKDLPVRLMVGFNRRFAPMVVRMKELVATTAAPRSMIMTVNAGSIPADHWTRDPEVGGGRIVGEACHFVDLLRHIAGSPISDFSVASAGSSGSASDSAMINLEFEDGSIGAIQYLTNGHRSFPKERLEVFVDGKALRLDNFRRLDGWGWPGRVAQRSWRQDKGQDACVQATLAAVIEGGEAPIALGELLEVSRISIELAQAAR